MSIILPYLVVVAILSLVAIGIVVSFARYRFQGDRTLLFLGLFAFSFVADVIITLSLLIIRSQTLGA